MTMIHCDSWPNLECVADENVRPGRPICPAKGQPQYAQTLFILSRPAVPADRCWNRCRRSLPRHSTIDHSTDPPPGIVTIESIVATTTSTSDPTIDGTDLPNHLDGDDASWRRASPTLATTANTSHHSYYGLAARAFVGQPLAIPISISDGGYRFSDDLSSVRPSEIDDCTLDGFPMADDNDQNDDPTFAPAAAANVPARGSVSFATDTVDYNENGTETKLTNSVEVVPAIEFDPMVLRMQDHFTLPLPSSTIRYRESRSAARIIENGDSQFVLEETCGAGPHDESQISIRSIRDGTPGERFLRITYVIVTAFWTGFLFVFCAQLLLFLVLDLSIQVGATTKSDINVPNALGVIFAIIPLLYSLASALVIAGAFILDTWRGHYLIRNFTFRCVRPITMEWVFFTFFLGLPLFIMGATMLYGTDYWWQITAVFWFSSIAAFYVIFCISITFYEIQTCWEVMNAITPEYINTFSRLLKESILLRQVAAYSGRKQVSYLSMGTIRDAEYTDKSTGGNRIAETYQSRLSLFTKITMWKGLSTEGRCSLKCFAPLEDPKRIFTIDDARDVRPYLTAHTWSLEKVFCRPRNSRYIAIVRGPGAVTRAQLRSSLICTLIGTFLIFFLSLAFLVYMQLGASGTIVMLLVLVVLAYPSFASLVRLMKVGKNLVGAKNEMKKDASASMELGERERVEDPKISHAVYLVNETYRITTPTQWFCWVILVCEIVFFYIWPLSALYGVGNWPLALLFMIVVGVTALRYYLNAAVVLEESGTLDLVKGTCEESLWRKQSRMNEIVGNITRGKGMHTWSIALGVFAFAFVGLFLATVGVDQETSFDTPLTYTNDFEFRQPVDVIRYPTCELTSDLGASPLKTMADYAFLAGLAYRSENATQPELDGWFGQSGAVVVDQNATVATYRDANNVTAAVSFKLVTMPENGNFAYVLIRGTQNNWDMMTDAQLWGAAILMQVVRAILPLGEMWTPIIDQCIKAISTVESESIEKVSFYKTTVAFVNFIRAQPDTYAGVAVTGHSLGGGLSIITGAQTKTPAVALSGPNAMLTRQALDPRVEASDLDRYTFNIIPDRDVVPMFDDVAQNYQRIRCETELSDFVGCHDSTRSLCEITYSCGSGGRPYICECYYDYNYPLPVAVGNRTFEEACPPPVDWTLPSD